MTLCVTQDVEIQSLTSSCVVTCLNIATRPTSVQPYSNSLSLLNLLLGPANPAANGETVCCRKSDNLPTTAGHCRLCACLYRLAHTPSIAFRHLPPKEGCRKPTLGVWYRLGLSNTVSCPYETGPQTSKSVSAPY